MVNIIYASSKYYYVKVCILINPFVCNHARIAFKIYLKCKNNILFCSKNCSKLFKSKMLNISFVQLISTEAH